jgi:hypothetical protein
MATVHEYNNKYLQEFYETFKFSEEGVLLSEPENCTSANKFLNEYQVLIGIINGPIGMQLAMTILKDNPLASCVDRNQFMLSVYSVCFTTLVNIQAVQGRFAY